MNTSNNGGIIWTIYQQENGQWYTAQLMDTSYRPTTFGVDNAGEIYMGNSRTGTIYKLVKPEE